MEKNLKTNKNAKEAGVSLIEIMVGLLLVAIALFTIVSIFPKMGAQSKGIAEADQARIIGMEALEMMQRLAAANTKTSATNYYCPGTISTCTTGTKAIDNYSKFTTKFDSVPMGGVTYKATPKTLTCASSSTNPFNTIVVEVSWTKANKTRQITVTGVIK